MTQSRKPFGVVSLAALAAVFLLSTVLSGAALATSTGTDVWGGPGAKGSGDAGSQFDTNVFISSVAEATGTVDFYAGGALVETVAFSELAATVSIIPAPASLAGLGAFLFRVRADSPVTVWSETFNETPTGRFGVSVAGFLTSDYLNPGDEAWAGGADASSSTDAGRARTNVGIMCNPTGTSSCILEVAAYQGSNFIGTEQIVTGPGNAAQRSLALLIPGTAGGERLVLRLRLLAGSGEPYVIKNDNQTSDATAIPFSVARSAFSTAPSITSFIVAPATGCSPQTVTATWTTVGADHVTISGAAGDLPANGSTTVQVLTTSDIILTAVAPSGATSVVPRRVTLSPPTDPPTPSPSSATVSLGGIVTGIIAFTSGSVTISFDQQESTGSTFTLNGRAWTYVAGTTAGTDVVRLTSTGICGAASATFTARVILPGQPAVVFFEADPVMGCAPANIGLNWQTLNATHVEITGIPFGLPANGFFGETLDTTTDLTLTAFGTTGDTDAKTVHVQVDTQTFIPILSVSSVTVPKNTQIVVNVTGVPDLTLLRRVPIRNDSGGSFTNTGLGQFTYRSGTHVGMGGDTIDIYRVFFTNGCGSAFATFEAHVTN